MGAMDPARWHSWHFSWKIGAMSLANVTGLFASGASAAMEKTGSTTRAPTANAAKRTFGFRQDLASFMTHSSLGRQCIRVGGLCQRWVELSQPYRPDRVDCGVR